MAIKLLKKPIKYLLLFIGSFGKKNPINKSIKCCLQHNLTLKNLLTNVLSVVNIIVVYWAENQLTIIIIDNRFLSYTDKTD